MTIAKCGDALPGMWSSSAIGWFSTFSCSLSSCNTKVNASAKPATFSKWFMSMWMKAWGCVCVCILCVLLYLVTRRLWNTAEAWPAHLSQRGPIAQGLIHRVNKHIICLWTQWRWNKAAHVQFYSWQTHTHTHIWGPFMNLGLKATDVVIVHPEITVVWCCGRSGGNLVTYPEQQELLRPHPEHQRLAEESWSSS